ncbi:MAG TPA: hypothetical protein VNW51_10355 [Mucilaginibacter sp.]|jgi:hypothetical protein|nr:hypothetical protein [Mucilaginibacter sp.]
MKRLVFLFGLTLPLLSAAQSVKVLKQKADSLQKLGKGKKAMKVYKQATDRILNYQERITDMQWLQLSEAKRINDYYVTKKKDQPYISYEYGNDGPKLKEKIKEVSAQGVKCLFTYNEWLGYMGPTIMVYKDPVGGNVGLPLDARTLLVWATNTDVYFQEFSSSNVYKPLVIHNDTLRNILINHADEMIHQPLKPEHYIHSEVPFYIFNFYVGQQIWEERLYDPKYLKNPEANNKTWLAKIMPLMWQEYKLYRANAIAGI